MRSLRAVYFKRHIDQSFNVELFKNTTFSCIDKGLEIIQYEGARGMNKFNDLVKRITIRYRCVQFVR